MTTGKMIVNVVDVGQGQCTFVEIYDLLGNLTNTLLLDCGTDKKSPSMMTNLAYVADKIESMAEPVLDLLLFSHSDNDHVSLMMKLLELCKPKKPKIKQVVYGGNRANYSKGKNKFNILTQLVKSGYCTDKVIVGPAPNFSGFDRDLGQFQMAQWSTANGDVRVDLLVGNVVSDDPEGAIVVQDVPVLKGAQALNRVSLVCSVTFNGHSYIICGDAVNRSMAWVNWYFQKAKSTFAIVPMLTLPHHGSRATGLDTTTGSKKKIGDKAKDPAIKTVTTFAKICNGQTLTASSFGHHGHPSMELVQYFIVPMVPKPLVKDLRANVNAHSMVSYVDMTLPRPNNDIVGQYDYRSYLTETNLFGTNYYNAAFPTGFGYNYGNSSVGDVPMGTLSSALNVNACWVYGNDNQNNSEMIGVSHLPPSTGTIFTEPVKGGQKVAHAAPALPRSNPRRAVVPSLARLRHFR